MERRKDDFHSYREYGVALYENGSISIYIRLNKVISQYYDLDPLDYYNNIYYLDINSKNIVKVFKVDSDNNVFRRFGGLFLETIINPSNSVKSIEISEGSYLKFKKLFGLYQIGKTNETFNIIYNYCNSLLQ